MPHGPSHARIFVSYARSDGKDIATKLRRQLEDEHGFQLWHDVADVEGGREWWRQVTDAIDHVEYLVLMITPAALNSPTVRKEWRYARQHGKCVIPVVGSTHIDFASLAAWMRRVHFVDPSEPDQWRRFIRTLEAPCRATRVPLMVEDLPADFVPRARELDALVAGILDEQCQEPIAISAALKGAGGYGKTTLARALCHDERIQDVFTDGILWVTLGQQPGDLVGYLQDLIEVLANERPGFQTLDAATARFAETLGDRHLLIVIDDVWNAAHAHPFLQGGPNCARVITTRDRNSLPQGVKAVEVDAMRATEAVKLLRFGLPEEERDAVERLAERLGEWPLLLKLVNRALHKRTADGQTMQKALEWTNRALDQRGLTAFDARVAVERSDAVAATLGVSLQLLDDSERLRFAELAVFPKDVDVPLATIAALWHRTGGLDEFDTDDLCERLFDLSLLLKLDLATRTTRLHDVIRRYLQPDIEILTELHRTLLTASRAKCPGGWATGPDDGYFLQHLPYHLAEAGHDKELRELVFDYRWLVRKLGAVGVAGLIEDFAKLGADHQSQRMAAALRLSAHALAKHAGQLPSQLLGRFTADEGSPIAALIANARASTVPPALLPLRSTLTPPGTPLLRILGGHSSGVEALAVLPCGTRALSGSQDNTMRLWDLETGAELRAFEGHSDRVSGVSVLPSGDQALSGSWDGTLRVWDLDTGLELRRIEGHSNYVVAVAALPDGRYALSGSWDGTLRLWDVAGSDQVDVFKGHHDPVTAVAVSSDGRHALSGSWDQTIRLWDLARGVELQRFEGHSGSVSAVALLPDDRHFLSGAEDRTVRLWDLDRGTAIRRLEGSAGPVESLVPLPDGRRVLSGCRDGTLWLWDLETGLEICCLSGHSSRISAVAALPDGKRAVSGGEDHTLRLWDLEGGAARRRSKGNTAAITALAIPVDSKRVLYAFDAVVQLCDLHSNALLRRFEGHTGRVEAVAPLPDGMRMITASCDRTLRLWDLDSGNEIRRFEGHRDWVKTVAVLPDGQHAVSGSDDKTLRLWHLASGFHLRRFDGHRAAVTAVAVLPDGERVVSGSADETLRVWSLALGTELRRFGVHRSPIQAIAPLPDGRRVLSAGADHNLVMWDVESGAELLRLTHDHGSVTALAALTKSDRALSASDDGTVRLWDLSNGAELAVFKGDAPFSRCAVTPDDELVLAGDGTGQIHVLQILL